MAVRIEKITAKNLGPIQGFSGQFGSFNLVYSKNECGKTFLTEFIIRCLFRNIKRWQLRERGSGKVLLSGLDEKGPVEFMPDTGKKLEDFWESSQSGIPPSLVKLLVSKGGESSIENTGEGIGKSLIKEVFSGLSLLDRIDDDKNISRTIKSAEFDEGTINISNAGEGRAYRQSVDDIDRLERLFGELESKYPGGMLDSLRSQAKIFKSQKDKLYRAKCHEAYLISGKIKELERQLKEKDEEKLNNLYSNISIYENKKRDLEVMDSHLRELKDKCSDYEWLKKVPPLYEKFSSNLIKKPGPAIIIIAGIFVIAAIIFAVFNIMPGTVISLAAAAVLAWLYIYKLSKASGNAGTGKELSKLMASFEERTKKKLTDLAVLNEEIEQQQSSYEKAKLLQGQIEQLKRDMGALEIDIGQKFYSFLSISLNQGQWMDAYSSIRSDIGNLKDEIESLNDKLLELAVRQAEYIEEDPGIKFSYEQFEKASKNLEETSSKISDLEKESAALKQSLCYETADDITIEWEKLIENLRNKREQKQVAHKLLKAQIIAGIIVHGEISLLRNEEDNKIAEGLKSEAVLAPLVQITKKYKNLTLDKDNLVVSDDYKDYYIRDLSTGAREQIMLALRIGFSSKILKQDRLFLILDDALQHSDWERREVLVDMLAEIAHDGWQVIYFTMDDHIKTLFDKAGKSFKKSDYVCLELGS
ncbi:MAG: hypothetical protein FJW68_07820 [Actinobacteria bacterium]|nr:hypothetical protein [Actinomycetota bacterium]